MFFKTTLLSIFILSSAYGASNLEDILARKSNSVNWYRSFISQMVAEKKYYTAIYWFKNYIAKGQPFNNGLDSSLAKVILAVGASHFEYLPTKYLSSTNSPTLHYIYAKKLMKRRQYSNALDQVNRISPRHQLTPFVYHMKAVLYSILKKHDLSRINFEDCVRTSKDSDQRSVLNKEACVVGLARNTYGSKNLSKAELQFLDVSKGSKFWPEILYEEAWTSYYRGQYNRSLGKLVTYKSPLLDHMFGPKIEVLNAISYLKLCLYNDAQKISDEFWRKYQKDYQRLRSLLLSKNKNYYYFYKLIVDFEKTKSTSRSYMESMLRSIVLDSRYQAIRDSFEQGTSELQSIKSYRNSSLSQMLSKNLESTLKDQQMIIGAFVNKYLFEQFEILGSAFESMSYIKLEVLAQKKNRLYSFTDESGKRGDVKFLKRNEKQYFWDFNGEFWADELGDYVFALKSECK